MRSLMLALLCLSFGSAFASEIEDNEGYERQMRNLMDNNTAFRNCVRQYDRQGPEEYGGPVVSSEARVNCMHLSRQMDSVRDGERDAGPRNCEDYPAPASHTSGGVEQ